MSTRAQARTLVAMTLTGLMHWRRVAGLSSLALLSLMPAHSALAGGAHTHGVAHLSVTVEATQLRLEFELPLDTLVGFERAPRTEAERESARAALARLREPGSLIKPDAGAQCRVIGSELDPSLLEGPARPAAAPGHADATLTVQLECAQMAQLRTVELLLFDAFRRLERVEAQVVTPKGQAKATVKRAAKTLRLPK